MPITRLQLHTHAHNKTMNHQFLKQVIIASTRVIKPQTTQKIIINNYNKENNLITNIY